MAPQTRAAVFPIITAAKYLLARMSAFHPVDSRLQPLGDKVGLHRPHSSLKSTHLRRAWADDLRRWRGRSSSDML